MDNTKSKLDALVGRLSDDLMRLPDERLEDGVSDALRRMLALTTDAGSEHDQTMSSAAPLLVSLLRRHREETRLRRAEAEYRTLVENAPYCIHQIDTDGRLISMNPAGVRMMGATDECEIQGSDYLNAVGESDRPRIADLLARAYAGEFSEFEFESSNGRRFQSNFVPIYDKDGGLEKLMGLTMDITARTELARQLQQAQKMESIGQLTGGIAHDFNNILSAILGYVDLAQLARVASSDPQLQRYLAEIQKAGLRGRDLVQHLLTFSRKNAGDPECVSAAAAVQSMFNMLKPTIPASIELTRAIADDELHVEIAPVQLEQALINLCINARDAVGERGRIAIRVSERTAGDARCASCQEAASGRHVEFSVTDTGAGIEGDVARIFEPFFTVKQAGTGMGLAIVDGIAHASGGHVTVVTEAGAGSTISLLLPVADDRLARQEIQASAAPELSADPDVRGHVVIVDDEPAIVKLLEDVLGRAGLRTTSFADSAAALDYLTAGTEHVDLLVTDQTMPGLTGLELADRLRIKCPDLPIVLCSGYSNVHDKSDLSQRNVRSYLSKPARVDEITDCVLGLIGAGTK